MLKKFILLFMMLISGLTFFVAFTSSERQAIHVAETAGTSIGRPFWIPPSALFSRPDSWSLIEPILDEASVQAHVNLIRTDMGYTKSNEAEITQYVLLTHRTQLFQSFQLQSGRFLGTTQGTGRADFLSTQRTENPHQVGVLKEFGGSPIVTIRPLQQAFQSIPLPGQYTVEAQDRRDYSAFLHDFVNGVNARYSKDMARPYRIKDVQQPTTSGNFVMPADFGEFGGGIFSSITSSIRTVGLLVFLATLVLIVYFGFHEAKRIGIMKMHGWTNRRIDGIGFISGSPASAVKVRLVDASALKTYTALKPLLRHLKLTGYLRQLVGTNTAILEAIQALQRELLIIGSAVGVLLVGTVVLATHALSISFTKYRRRFAVRRLFGYALIRTYREPLRLFLGTWITQMAIAILLSTAAANGGPQNTYQEVALMAVLAAGIAGGVVIVEMVALTVAVYRTERRNIAMTMKEGT